MSGYPFPAWFIGTVAVSFVYTWLYNSTQGSLLVVTLFHVLWNTFGVVVSGVSITAMAVVCVGVAVLLVAVFGQENLTRRKSGRVLTQPGISAVDMEIFACGQCTSQ